jgi:HAD superfamily hydrolase (TIGR01549 family)
MLRAVVLDVDFTLVQPGPGLGPEGYRLLGARYGLDLDPARYAEARRAAVADLKHHPELDHDEEVWIRFTEDIILGMGSCVRGAETRAVAVEMTDAWRLAGHFERYDDVLPSLAGLRALGLRIGLLSNTTRDLDEFVAHHGLDVDAVLTSGTHGKLKPHATIFNRMLELLGVAAAEAAMVGDTLEDDVEGARRVGMHALLLDREGRYPEVAGRLTGLGEVVAALAALRA